MKTPKRETSYNIFIPCYYKGAGPSDDVILAQRWRSKNRVKQLKRTIKRLTMGEHLLPAVQGAYRAMRFMVAPGKGLKGKLKYIQQLTLLAKHFSMLAVNEQDSLLNELRRQELGGGDTKVLRSEDGKDSDGSPLDDAVDDGAPIAGCEKINHALHGGSVTGLN